MAEFFVIGSEVERQPGRALKIVREGHTIQNHSYSHLNLQKAPEAEVRSQVAKTQHAIFKATGKMATLIRPPYGAGGWAPHDPELAKVAGELSLKIQNWDIDTNDWRVPKGIGASKINEIKKQFEKQSSKRKFNVLMHVQAETAKDLQVFIKQLKDWDFGFVKP